MPPTSLNVEFMQIVLRHPFTQVRLLSVDLDALDAFVMLMKHASWPPALPAVPGAAAASVERIGNLTTCGGQGDWRQETLFWKRRDMDGWEMAENVWVHSLELQYKAKKDGLTYNTVIDLDEIDCFTFCRPGFHALPPAHAYPAEEMDSNTKGVLYHHCKGNPNRVAVELEWHDPECNWHRPE